MPVISCGNCIINRRICKRKSADAASKGQLSLIYSLCIRARPAWSFQKTKKKEKKEKERECQLLTGSGWEALNLLLHHRESIAQARGRARGQICVSGLYTARAESPVSAQDAFLSEGGHMLFLRPWEFSPLLFSLLLRLLRLFFSLPFSFPTMAARLKPLAQFAVNKINWRTDKGIKCCSAS